MYGEYEIYSANNYSFALLKTTIQNLAEATPNSGKDFIPQIKIEKGPVLGFVIDKNLTISSEVFQEKTFCFDKDAWAIAHLNKLDGSILIITEVAEKLNPQTLEILIYQKAQYLSAILRDKERPMKSPSIKPRDRLIRQLEADKTASVIFGKERLKEALLEALELNVETIIKCTGKLGIETNKVELTKMLLNDHEFSERLIELS